MTVAQDPDVAMIAQIGAVETILRVVAQVTGLRLTLIARVTEDTWKACAVYDRMNFGLVPGGLLDIATTLCSEVRSSRAPIVIECASEDPIYATHHTPKLYGIESYIAVPIFLPDGSYFGNVCALDSLPAQLKGNETLPMMQLYADLIGMQLDAERRQEQTRVALLDERATAELREQFIAVLGHDMRTPLGSISAGVRLLQEIGVNERERKVIERMARSAGRMARLVDDLLDFARGRLGGGIPLETVHCDGVESVAQQVVEEVRATHPTRVIEYTHEPSGAFRADPARLGQLLSNLIVNALQHSDANSPVKVHTCRVDGQVRLTVSNQGEPIPDNVRERLFQPFFRGTADGHNKGLGLGLYIVSEIVKSHGGHIEVSSSPEHGTSFRCSLPTDV